MDWYSLHWDTYMYNKRLRKKKFHLVDFCRVFIKHWLRAIRIELNINFVLSLLFFFLIIKKRDLWEGQLLAADSRYFYFFFAKVKITESNICKASLVSLTCNCTVWCNKPIFQEWEFFSSPDTLHFCRASWDIQSSVSCSWRSGAGPHPKLCHCLLIVSQQFTNSQDQKSLWVPRCFQWRCRKA